MANGSQLIPSTHELLNFINSISGQIKAAGGTPSIPQAPGIDPVTIGNLLAKAVPTDAQAVANAQAQIGKGKLQLTDLPLDVRKLVISKQNIGNQQPHRGLFGSILHGAENVGGSALQRVGDVLSRGQYTIADAEKHAYDAAVTHPGSGPLGVLKQIGEGAKGFAQGAGAGITGKEKGSFEDFIQHVADTKHFTQLGDTPQQAVAHANAHPGAGHANPWLKHAGGLAGDIVLDPTTYLGVGLAGKAIRGVHYAEDLAKTEKVAKDAERLGVASKGGMESALGKGLLPDKGTFKAKLPNMKMVAETQKIGRGTLEEYARKSSQETWNQAVEKIKPTIKVPVGEGKLVAGGVPKTVGAQLKADHRLWELRVKQATEAALGRSQDQLREDALRNLLDIQERMTTAQMSKELGLRFAGKKVAALPVSKLFEKAAKLQAGDSSLAQGIRGYQKLFINSAGINKEVNEYKVAAHGATNYQLRSILHNVHDKFSQMTQQDIKRIADAYKGGLDVEIKNHKGENVLNDFRSTIDRVQHSVTPLTGDLSAVNELRAKLPVAMRYALKDDAVYKIQDGKRVLKDNWLDQAVKKWLEHDSKNISNPSHIMYYVDAALHKARNEAELFRSLGDTFGHRIRQTEEKFGSKPYADESVRYLIDKHGYKKATRQLSTEMTPGTRIKSSSLIPYLQGHVFHPETADAITNLYRLMHDVKPSEGYELKKLLQMHNQVLRIWRSLVTKYNPGYYERNMLGEVAAGFFGGVNDPRRYAQAARVLHGRDSKLLGDGEAFLPKGRYARKQVIRSANALSHAPENAGKYVGAPVAIWKIGRKEYRLTPDQWFHNYSKYGLKTAFIHESLDTGLDPAKRNISRLLENVNTRVQGGAEGVEDLPRMAHFIDATIKGTKKGLNLDDAMRSAAEQVRKYHFDFTDFTPFEQNVMSSIFPFYKWTRKNLPLMMQMAFAQPGKAVMPLKALRAISNTAGFDNNGRMIPQGDMIVSDWLSKDLAQPVGTTSGGNTMYMDAPLPFYQAFQAVQSPRSTLGQMLNPVLQSGYQIFSKGKLPSGNTAHGIGVVNNLPQVSVLRNLLSGHSQGKSNLTTLLNYLSGMGFQENTQNRMYAEAKRQQQQAANNRTKLEKQQGTYRSTRMPGVY